MPNPHVDGNKSTIVHAAAAQVKAAKVIVENNCMVEGINVATGLRFTKSFPNYAALEQWLTTADASNFEVQYVRQSGSF
jgi:hypothetical protein